MLAKQILFQQQTFCAILLKVQKEDMMPSESEFITFELLVKVMKLMEITEDIEIKNGLLPYVYLVHKILHISENKLILWVINLMVFYFVYKLRHQRCLFQVLFQLLPTTNLILQFKGLSIPLYLDSSGRQRAPM